jgi:hypothetical protein
MKCAARVSTLILAGFLAMTSACVPAVGQGGGHGGSGGHAGGHGGHSSWGSSGHSSGHSMGHSFAHIFGHHERGASPAGLKRAAPDTPSPQSVPRALDRLPKSRFMFRPRIGFVLRRQAFGFGGCPYEWFDYDFRIGDNWNCSNDSFFFDPFFSGWFSGPLPTGPANGGATWFEGGTTADSTAESPAESNRAYPPINSDSINETPNPSRNTAPLPSGVQAEQRFTLLQLRDGSMYGLTDYWFRDGQLHYTTTYGGQNSLPFERIDFEKTVQLNADRGVPFVLPPPSVPR